MTFRHDPPRLRELGQQLPSELSSALKDSPDDAPPPEALARLWKTLRAHESWRPRAAPRPRRGPMAAVALTFALGAAAGVLGSSGVFLALQATQVDPRPAASSPSAPPRLAPAAPPPRSSAAPAEAPSGVAALPPPRAARDMAASPEISVPAPSVSAPGAGSGEELTLVARAQSALANSPALALSLASEHEERFAQGVLVQERELVAIDALLRLGRRSEAEGRALRFHRQFPGSVHGRRIDVLLGKIDHN